MSLSADVEVLGEFEVVTCCLFSNIAFVLHLLWWVVFIALSMSVKILTFSHTTGPED